MLLTAAAFTTALAVIPAQTATTAPAAESASLVQLADARARWARALDDANWDRDAPSARRMAEALTNEVLPLREGSSEVRAQSVALLEDLAADALGPVTRVNGEVDVRLATAFLTRHDDPALLNALLSVSTTPSGEVPAPVLALATAHRAIAASALEASFEGLGEYGRERACRAALALPDGPRAHVAAWATAHWTAVVPTRVGPACVALGALIPSGRDTLVHWLVGADLEGRVARMEPVPAWVFPAAFAVASGPGATPARSALAPFLADRAPTAPEHVWGASLRALSELASALPLETPLARQVLARATRLFPLSLASLGVLRLRARDPSLAADALDSLQDTHGPPEQIHASLALASLTAARGAQANRLRARLASLREQVRMLGITDLTPGAIDRWIQALDDVDACHGVRGCLVHLLASGSDTAAARSVVALGPHGMTTLTAAETAPLVRRLAVRPDDWLLAAVLATVDRCTTSWRGLREAHDSGTDSDLAGVVAPMLEALDRTCAAR